MNKKMKKNMEWRKLGSVGVDAGCLMICDPCYVVGSDAEINKAKPGGWTQFIEDHFRYGDGEEDVRNVPYAMGHNGLGVVASTRHGDGHYAVYGLYPVGETSNQRPCAMMVVTDDLEEGESLPPLP